MLTEPVASAIQVYVEEINNLDSIDLMELQMLIEDTIGQNSEYESIEMDAFVRLFRRAQPVAYKAILADTSPELLAYLKRVEVAG